MSRRAFRPSHPQECRERRNPVKAKPCRVVLQALTGSALLPAIKSCGRGTEIPGACWKYSTKAEAKRHPLSCPASVRFARRNRFRCARCRRPKFIPCSRRLPSCLHLFIVAFHGPVQSRFRQFQAHCSPTLSPRASIPVVPTGHYRAAGGWLCPLDPHKGQR